MCQDWRVAQSEREPEQSQIGDAVLDTMRGAMRILGGVVKMAAGMTRLFAVAVLKAAAAAERAVEASEVDEEKPAPKPKPRDSRPGEPGLS
jgi:2-methylcitrate dehydratase PrpD